MSEASKPRLGAGDVHIQLVGEDGSMEERVLKPSYHAAKTLSAQSGGLVRVGQRILDGDVDLIVSVISLGLGYGVGDRRPPKDLAERVWRTGIFSEGGIAERCATYVSVLMSGGRLPVTSEEGEEAAEGGDQDPPLA